MAIKHSKIGTLYPKKFYYNEVPANGAELVLCGLMVPRFVVASQYWMNVMVGTQEGAAAVPPDAKVTYRIAGRSVPLPIDIDNDLAANNTWLEKMRLYSPIGEISLPGDEQSAAAQDVGMIGGVDGYVNKQSNQFFTREKTLGLPKNAVFTDADSILMQDAFSTKGRIPYRLSNPEQMNMLVWGVTVESDEQGSSSDEGSQLGVGTSTYADLSGEMVNFFEGASDVNLIADPDFDFAGTFPQLDGWLRTGFLNGFTPDLFVEDAELTFRVRLTVKCDIVLPRGMNSLSGP